MTVLNKKLLGIIDATSSKETIENLTLNRSLAAIPFAGRYRLIDFVLSNMVNSGIESVAIFPKFPYRSLMDHLGSGKQWDLNRKRDGLFFFPSPDMNGVEGSFQAFEHHLDYFNRSTQKYALIANSHTVCNIDYKPILKRHIETGCSITEVRYQGVSLNMYILETSLLMELVSKRHETGYMNMEDVVTDFRHDLKIGVYEHLGYVASIDSISSYYNTSMNLLSPGIWKQLFLKTNPILTKVKDEPPTRYMKSSAVKNSMIANGCVIEGTVENSIIFRGVKIGKGTVIKNSIVMQKSQIGDGCVLDSVILDKDVKIGYGVKLAGTKETPYVVRKGTVQGALMGS